MKDKKPKTSAPELLSAIHAKFPSPFYVTLHEVRDSTGFDSRTSADALALGMYSSRGRELWGFEFKVSRSDWLCELRKPAKAESWFQFCDRWALVVPSGDEIAKVEELPPGWGLGVVKNGRLKWTVEPPQLRPIAIDRATMCAFLYRALQEQAGDMASARDEGYQEGLQVNEKRAADAVESMCRMRDGIRAFEDATGFRYRYSFHDVDGAKKLGEAVRQFTDDHRRDLFIGRFQREAEVYEHAAAGARERLATVEAAIAAIRAGQSEEQLLINDDPLGVLEGL